MNEITLKECADLIERLLSYAKNQGGWHNIDETCEEAASEVSRLTEEVERLNRERDAALYQAFPKLRWKERAEAAEARVKELEAEKTAFGVALQRAHDRLGSVSIPPMEGENLAVTLCSHFDDGGESDDDCYWSAAAIAGCDQTLQAIQDHYTAALYPSTEREG